MAAPGATTKNDRSGQIEMRRQPGDKIVRGAFGLDIQLDGLHLKCLWAVRRAEQRKKTLHWIARYRKAAASAANATH